MNHRRPARNRQLLMTLAAALALGAGLVLAAQETGQADRFAGGTARDQRPTWVPGTDVPMLTYLGDRDFIPAPPR